MKGIGRKSQFLCKKSMQGMTKKTNQDHTMKNYSNKPTSVVRSLFTTTLSFIAICLLGCTSSPVENNAVSEANREISGLVLFPGGAPAEDVFLWLEVLDINTRTNASGAFTITIPKPSEQGLPDGLSGVFKLYAYVANYSVQTINVIIRNGSILYSNADVGKNGVLLQTVVLQKKLAINISTLPAEVNRFSQTTIQAQVTLQATTEEPITVIYRKSGQAYSTRIFLKNIQTKQIYSRQTFTNGLNIVEQITVEQTPQTHTILFRAAAQDDDDASALPLGEYELIPYMLIENNDIPTELFESMGEEVLNATGEFFKVPYQRTGASFKIL